MKKNNLSTIILVFIFLVGLSVLLYPTVSDFWNEKRQSEAIVDYDTVINQIDEKDYTKNFEEAEKYNKAIKELSFPLMSYDEVVGYDDSLNISKTGMMGYITIDKIKVQLPIYHGTSEAVLNSAVGHLEGTSLPIGGESTHCVLSAHRGLPSAKLFTNLDKMEVGDTFTITVLDRVLTYQVDQILIVLPQEVEELYIKDGEDYCTLVTCTPYGINTHRILVRGTRIQTTESDKNINVATDAYLIDPLIVTPAVAAPMLFVLLVVLLVKYRKKKGKN